MNNINLIDFKTMHKPCATEIMHDLAGLFWSFVFNRHCYYGQEYICFDDFISLGTADFGELWFGLNESIEF